jgi:hypothetical protein
MGKNSNQKQDRQNMRQIVKDLLKETITAEFSAEIEAKLKAHLDLRLNHMQKQLSATLAKVEDDTKTILSGIARSSTPLALK